MPESSVEVSANRMGASERFSVGQFSTEFGQAPSFARDTGFFDAVRRRVTVRFAGRALRGDPTLKRKAMVVFGAFAVCWAALLLAPSLWAYLAASLGFAFAAAGMAFNIFHDANHGAMADTTRGNLQLSSLSSALLGPSRHLWRAKHHDLHHKAPNVFGWDDDLETRGYLRLSPDQPWQWWFSLQWLYLWPLYAFNSIEWIFLKDFVQYSTRRLNKWQTIPALTAREHREFWVGKAAYAVIAGAPLLTQPGWRVLAGFFVFHLTLSLLLAAVFQTAHLNDRVAFPGGDHEGEARKGDEWAMHQLRTTANYATGDKWVGWFTGGLNFQVEHHLFPSVSSTHYPEISIIVRNAAAEFGVPYHVFHTVGAAVASHVRLVRALGVRPTG